jgi:hypothetical protein
VDGAAALFENYNNDKVLQDHFTLIKNTPQAVPRYGDVIIWNRKKGRGTDTSVCSFTATLSASPRLTKTGRRRPNARRLSMITST